MSPVHPLVTLEAATKAYGPRVLLDQVSLGVAAGDRIGVVGRNGAGKSTLLEVLAGRGGLDSGRATRARDLDVGYLPQAEGLTGTVRELVFGSIPVHEWAGEARGRSVIAALLPGIDPEAAAQRLSGGERRRVALAGLLLSPHDLLLLDEPTNHLDIDGVQWLAGYLREHARSFVVVTHDRWFLDAVTERTWEVADGYVHSYDGGYSAYVLARAERARIADAADARRRNLLRKELAWLRRGPQARTSKPRFRVEAANALIAGEPPARDSVELSRLATARLGKTVIDLEDVSVLAGERRLLDDVTWQLGPGERVGVVGVNGTGKTTLLQLLAGTLPGSLVTTGRVVRGKTVRIGYLTQEPVPVDPGLRALEAAEQVRSLARVGGREMSASQLLDRLGLTGERQWVPVAELSGGERRRLQLMLVLLGEPNVLLLDEPTNDLDIETLTELEDTLDGWPGSMVVVSHDRYFLERACDHVVALLDEKLAYLPGGVSEYLDRRERQQRAAERAPARPAAPAPAAGTAARQRTAQKELARVERQLDRLSGQEAELTTALADNASDYTRLIELGAQLREVQDEKAGLEDRWLALAEELSG
ncbi:MAG TPA: ABC-F family ATP-binding cassette domain-containing protein [Streptosporangiaceae bacterium]|nr:ABC-F family ATP-binding cassette domain-containing protein [Streptosporangiaceae bacterium]